MKRALPILLLAVFTLAPQSAHALIYELTLGFSFNRSNLSEDNSFTWSRRYGASVGFHFSERSGVELSFQDIYGRTVLAASKSNYHDRVYSINWIQHIFPKKFPVQPYFKLGVGQLNRDAFAEYTDGFTVEARLDSITVIMSLGLKVYIMKNFAIRTEATSYMEGARLDTWDDNFAFQIGLSFFL